MPSNSDRRYETGRSRCIHLIPLLIAVTGLDFDPRRLSGPYPFESRVPRCYLMPRVTILSHVDTYLKLLAKHSPMTYNDVSA